MSVSFDDTVIICTYIFEDTYKLERKKSYNETKEQAKLNHLPAHFFYSEIPRWTKFMLKKKAHYAIDYVKGLEEVPRYHTIYRVDGKTLKYTSFKKDNEIRMRIIGTNFSKKIDFKTSIDYIDYRERLNFNIKSTIFSKVRTILNEEGIY